MLHAAFIAFLAGVVSSGGGVQSFDSVNQELAVRVVTRDQAPVLELTNRAATIWALRLPADSRVVNVGLAPDLDHDGVREIRVALLAGGPTLTERTWLVSGRSGRLLFIIDGRFPFDPWLDDPREINADGEVTIDDELGVVLSFSWPWFQVAIPSRWAVLRRDSIPRNVRRVGSAVDDLSVNEAREDDRHHRARIGGEPLGPGATTVQLKEVRFSNSHTVYRDRIVHAGTGPAYTPWWLDSNGDGDADDWADGDMRSPICYTSGTRVTVSQVTFLVDPPRAIDTATAKAFGHVAGGDPFESTALQYNAAGDELTATMTGEGPTFNAIAQFADWAITWRIDEIGTPNSYAAGQSRNSLHFILLPPGTFTLYYSLIDIGCRSAHAMDGSDHRAIADAIFGEFSDLVVVRATDVLEDTAPPTPLAYYERWDCVWIRYDQLLTNGDGQCGAWADFFVRCLHAVGIDPVKEVWELTYNDNPNIYGADAVMLVKNWTFAGQGSNNYIATAKYPYINLPIFCPVPPAPYWVQVVPGNPPLYSYIWSFADVSDATGIPGQKPIQNPASLFGLHYIVEVDDKLYDPSYASGYVSFGALESAVIDGYGLFFLGAANQWPQIPETDFNIDINCDGVITNNSYDTVSLILRQNPAGNQLNFREIELAR